MVVNIINIKKESIKKHDDSESHEGTPNPLENEQVEKKLAVISKIQQRLKSLFYIKEKTEFLQNKKEFFIIK